jgi:hypothetical protein
MSKIEKLVAMINVTGLIAYLFSQLKFFKGIRFTLFNYNRVGVEGGFVDFNDFNVLKNASLSIR